MTFNRYYEKELVALRTLGREFSEKNPALAPFLGTPGRDPDVERILEGFAFLTGRLQQKIEDELPEITHGLFNLLWPNYLRPIPSCSVIEYRPNTNTSGHRLIPKKTTVESCPVGGTRCTFQTVYDVNVYPLRLDALSFVTEFGNAILQLDFSLLNANLGNTEIEELTFFLTGERNIVTTLHYYLTRKAKKINITAKDALQGEHILGVLPAEAICPMGFGNDEILFPFPKNSFQGYRIVQEYFCFPEKFHFVRIRDIAKNMSKEALDRVKDNGQNLSLQIVFDNLPEGFEDMTKDNIRLFCTPVVNIFEKSATPINFDHKQTEYRIVPDPRHPYSYSTYSVNRVTGWSSAARGEIVYTPFESFDHLSRIDGSLAYYRLRIRPAVKDESIETWISLVHRDDNHVLLDEVETISLELVCTNRMLPLELSVGDIANSTDSSDESLRFTNITHVSPPYTPPLDGDILWRLLSNMALNYIPLTDINALRGILATYDFRAIHDKRRARVLEQTLQGMRHISCQETDRIYRGMPIRGSMTTLTLNRKYFSSEGDMLLFASVINEFLALYATVNSFHQLLVQEEKTGEQFQWKARLGPEQL